MSHILIVDDDIDFLHHLSHAVRLEGHDVEVATNGQDALKALRAGPTPGLILLDLAMPIMDGVEFRALQRQDPALAQIPVVVLSGEDDAGELAQAMGAVGCLQKPFELEDLRQALAGQQPASPG